MTDRKVKEVTDPDAIRYMRVFMPLSQVFARDLDEDTVLITCGVPYVQFLLDKDGIYGEAGGAEYMDGADPEVPTDLAARLVRLGWGARDGDNGNHPRRWPGNADTNEIARLVFDTFHQAYALSNEDIDEALDVQVFGG